MEKYRITGAKLLTPYRTLEKQDLLIENGLIKAIIPDSAEPTPDFQTIPAQGLYLSPGFIDMHTHGGGGFDFMDGTPDAILHGAYAHLCHGTTSIVPTTLSGDLEETLRFLKVFSHVKETSADTANLLGVHLEGPYFSLEQKGAQDPAYICDPNPEQYRRILDACPYLIRWSFAPELNGSDHLIQELKERGILPSIGHSNATYEDVMSAFECGATHITHLYSCMSTITRKNGFRQAGVLESAMMLDEMSVELIADGCHVPPELLNMVYRIKGPDKIALVTDSMRAAGTSTRESILGSLEHGQKVLIEDGVAKLPDRSAFAGSVATMDRLVRTAISAGIPLCDAVRMASSTPAHLLGLKKKGVLSPGNDADLILFDENITIHKVWVKGQLMNLKRR